MITQTDPKAAIHRLHPMPHAADGEHCKANRLHPRRRAGFTLIELMIVVTIMGILAGIAAHSFGNTRSRTYDAGMRSNLAHAMVSLEDYNLQFGEYPPDLATFQAGTSFILTNGTVWDIYNRELVGGEMSVEMQVSNPGSPNAWYAHYPANGKRIDQIGP